MTWKSTAYTATSATRKAKYLASARRLARAAGSEVRNASWLMRNFIEGSYTIIIRPARARRLPFRRRLSHPVLPRHADLRQPDREPVVHLSRSWPAVADAQRHPLDCTLRFWHRHAAGRCERRRNTVLLDSVELGDRGGSSGHGRLDGVRAPAEL